ncbi:hypothetical protein AO377_1792 [Moraxella catarrhalis]|nr:hypothetical protein AO377_1792 [Moraxella catarrhalis]OAV34221.1 hypothetical protein AO365_1441 [Moraxella catarrhalis]OAV36972.1 hypothetical protein AO364_0882 [Moraxella catarrhalis]
MWAMIISKLPAIASDFDKNMKKFCNFCQNLRKFAQFIKNLLPYPMINYNHER